MKTIRYSVIIPVYNGEKTVKRAVDSLLNQGRADAEILLISDGSADKTDAIAEEYGEKIRFFRQDHAGVSAARNFGLSRARGEYITFVDSDDFVAPDYFAALDEAPDCDLLVFGAAHSGGDPLEYLLKSRAIMSCCNKRFRREFLESRGLRFPEGWQVGEDFCFCLACALGTEALVCIPADIYRVDISNKNSLSRGFRPDLDQNMAAVFDAVAELPGAEQYGDVLEELRLRQILGCLAEEWKAGMPSRQRVTEICTRFRNPVGKPRRLAYRLIGSLLKKRWDRALFWLAYLGKGRTFREWRKRC